MSTFSVATAAAARGVPAGVDRISPARHSASPLPIEMMHFIATMRRSSGSKPAGFKLSIGTLVSSSPFARRCWRPKFIRILSSSTARNAAPAPLEIRRSVREGLNFVHNGLTGVNARDRTKLGAAGEIVSSFDIARVMALCADWCNSARGFMFALGCIQSQSCHTDRCPTGVSTQDRTRQRALVVADKSERVFNFHRATAAGLYHPNEFRPAHFFRRVSAYEVMSFAALYPILTLGELIAGTADKSFNADWAMANAAEFRSAI
jgi:glutamate synthase domain-containing protein 2